MEKVKNAARLVSSALLGMDYKTVVVAGKAYVIIPPTIKRIAGASYHLSTIGEGNTVRDVLKSVNSADKLSRALSWLIQGDESLSDSLSEGTLDEVLDALEAAYSLISTRDFSRLSALARNVASLAARQRQ